MAADKTPVTGGVDTHSLTHHAAVVDQTGRPQADKQFPATAAGHRALLAWLRRHGTVVKVGVEVDRPDRKTRRTKGKSDPIDAIAAARAALSGQADGTPKTRTGPVEAIRALRVARHGAVKARTAALNQLHGLVTSAPQKLRDELDAQPGTAALVAHCAALVVNDERMADPVHATRAALRAVAERVQHFDAELAQADKRIRPLVAKTAPTLTSLMGVGPEVAGQLLVTAGDNPERLRSEAALAHLCGVAPIPASSGRKDRHRLTAATTAPPTTPSTQSSSAACATTREHAKKWIGKPNRVSARRRSCAASNGLFAMKVGEPVATRHRG